MKWNKVVSLSVSVGLLGVSAVVFNYLHAEILSALSKNCT